MSEGTSRGFGFLPKEGASPQDLSRYPTPKRRIRYLPLHLPKEVLSYDRLSITRGIISMIPTGLPGKLPGYLDDPGWRVRAFRSPEGDLVPSTSCRGGDRGRPPIQGIGGFPGSLNRRWFQIFTVGSPRGSIGSYHPPRGISSGSGVSIRGYSVRSPILSRAGDPGFSSFLSQGRGLNRFREDLRVSFCVPLRSFRGTISEDRIRRPVMIFCDRFHLSRRIDVVDRFRSPVRVVSNTAI